VRQIRNKIRSYDLIPEILELLKKSGPTRTVDIKDQAVKVADYKALVYREEEVTRALTILKRRSLVLNATHGIWSATSEGCKHPKITAGQARDLTAKSATAAKERSRGR
jgi:hypothetical protein